MAPGCRRHAQAARRLPGAWRLLALGVAGALLAACTTPPARRAEAARERVAEARAAKRATERAQRRQAGCQFIVSGMGRRATTPPRDLLLLTDAYAERDVCWERITFVFEPTGTVAPPGYEVEYRDPPFTEGPDNEPVDTSLGKAFLFVTFTPASQTDGRNPGHPIQTYKGNLRLRLGEEIHHTLIVRKLIDGEDPPTVMWIIGLDEKRPFTVDAANDPPRVNVLIM